MKVRVQYLGQVGVIAQRKEEELEIPSGAIVRELLQRLSSKYGKAFDGEVFQEDGENLRDDMTVVVNGTAVRQLEYLNTRLKQDDTVALLPIFPGGG